MSGVASIDYYQHCVHCGLCLPNCPTYVELGDENDSPRGRIYLMQAIDEGRIGPSERIQHHLDLCLDCRACETVCPSGVQYGRLIESYRTNTNGDQFRKTSLFDRLVRWITLNIFPHRRRTRWFLRTARLARAIGLFEFLGATGPAERYAAVLRFPEILDQPPAPAQSRRTSGAAPAVEAAPRPQHDIPIHTEPADGPSRASVGLFLGCVGESILGRTNRATRRVLLRNKCAVSCPAGQVCCGAIHYHAGDKAQAARFAKANIEAFETLHRRPRSGLNRLRRRLKPLRGQIDAIVVNVAGCGLMLKQYDELLDDDPEYAEQARRFAGKIRDVNEFLADLHIDPPPFPIHARATYHQACHLCHGQGIWDQPRELLNSIRGLELVDLNESDWCCGAAGSYSLTQPEMASRLARRKLRNIDETHSQIVAVANAGCILHLRQHAALTNRELAIVHPIDLLDRAYGPPAQRVRTGSAGAHG